MLKTVVPVSEPGEEGSFASQAYELLRSAILEGRLPPGTPLSRRGLALELGMSAVPIGDALARLEAEGFVESRPRAGTRVRIPTAEEIHGNYVLREALETHAARLFAESADERSRQRLLRAAERLDARYSALNRGAGYTTERHAQVERQHIEFHLLIARLTRVRTLADAIERSRVLLFNWLFTLSPQLGPLPPRWHSELAEALARGAPEAAAEAMRIHVRFRQEEVIEKFRQTARQYRPGRIVRGPQRVKLTEIPRLFGAAKEGR